MSIPKIFYNKTKSLKMKKDALEQVVKFQKMLGRHEEKTVGHVQNALALFMDEVAEFVDEFVVLDESDLDDNVDFDVLDRRNIAKESADVIYTLVGILEMMNIPVVESLQKVNESNFSKFLPSKTMAESQVLGVRKKYQMIEGGETVDIKSVTIEGEDYFYFSRTSDGKMLKPISYEEADMSHIDSPSIERI